jgi:hypothetical protein
MPRRATPRPVVAQPVNTDTPVIVNQVDERAKRDARSLRQVARSLYSDLIEDIPELEERLKELKYSDIREMFRSAFIRTVALDCRAALAEHAGTTNIAVAELEDAAVEGAARSIQQTMTFGSSKNADGTSVQGAQGEIRVRDALISAASGSEFTVGDVAKRGYRADLVLTNSFGESVLIEVKNYTNTVPTAEVEKLYRDLDLNRSARCGVFIVLGARISRHPDESIFMQHRIIGDRVIPVLFVCLFEATPQMLIELMRLTINLCQYEMRKSSVSAQKFDPKRAMRLLNDLLDSIAISRRNVRAIQETTAASVNSVVEQLSTIEGRLSAEIRALSDDLQITKSVVSRESTECVLDGLWMQYNDAGDPHKLELLKSVVGDVLVGASRDTSPELFVTNTTEKSSVWLADKSLKVSFAPDRVKLAGPTAVLSRHKFARRRVEGEITKCIV